MFGFEISPKINGFKISLKSMNLKLRHFKSINLKFKSKFPNTTYTSLSIWSACSYLSVWNEEYLQMLQQQCHPQNPLWGETVLCDSYHSQHRSLRAPWTCSALPLFQLGTSNQEQLLLVWPPLPSPKAHDPRGWGWARERIGIYRGWASGLPLSNLCKLLARRYYSSLLICYC